MFSAISYANALQCYRDRINGNSYFNALIRFPRLGFAYPLQRPYHQDHPGAGLPEVLLVSAAGLRINQNF
ncbi:hypothetical protein BH18ACI4_BH18ACI4_21120 [soil metagenome]